MKESTAKALIKIEKEREMNNKEKEIIKFVMENKNAQVCRNLEVGGPAEASKAIQKLLNDTFSIMGVDLTVDIKGQ